MLRPWSLAVQFEAESRAPKAQQLVQSIIEDIRRGRLKAGAPLPGSRELASNLKVNRKTVIEAYRELEAQGWVVTELRRGTFIAEHLPRIDPASRPERRASSPETRPAFLSARRLPSLQQAASSPTA